MATKPQDVEAREHERLLEDKKEASVGGTTAAIVTLEAIGETPPFGKTAFGEWVRLRALLEGRKPEPEPESDRMVLGRLMEPVIATLFTRTTGLDVAPVPMLRHPAYTWATGHMDRATVQSPGDLEIKLVTRDRGEWSKPGEAQRVPQAYLLQPVWYAGIPRPDFRRPPGETIEKRFNREMSEGDAHMNALDAFERDLYMAAQIGLEEKARVYHWVPDENIRAIFAVMLEACQKFWEEHVLTGDPPPASEAAARDWLRYRYPHVERNEVATGDAHMVEIAKAYDEARKKEGEGKKEKERLGIALATLVGNFYGMQAQADGWYASVTYPEIAEQREVDWEAVVRDLGISVAPEVVARNMKVAKKAYRRMNVKVNGGAKLDEE